MLKFYSKCRGAVSVFLVIILVPMITCSSLFVDASRVKSAKGLVSSSGDLTLNTVLSQYDVDLNDFYGLMASAQNMDDVLGAAEEYFTSCIKSQGINTTDAAKWANSIKNVFMEDGDISDLLGVDLAPETHVNISPVKNGNLTNPALVKTQIVEFMKYRSPINSVTALFDKFKNSSKELENTAKTSDLVDKKQDYYEAQGKVADKGYKIYQKIQQYDSLGITNADLQNVKNFVNSLPDKYKECHVKMIKDLYNTQNISGAEFNYCEDIPSTYSHNKRYDSASAQTIKGLIDSLMRSYDQFINANNSFNNDIKAWNSSYYDIQYWVYCNKNSTSFKNVYSKSVNLKNSYIKLKDSIEHAKDGALSEDYMSTYNSSNISEVSFGTQMSIESWWDFLSSKVQDAIDSVTRSDSKFTTCVSHVKSINNLYERISTTDTNRTLSELYNTLNDYYTRYKLAYQLLTDIVNNLGDLKNLINDADGKFNTWENKANEYSSDIKMARTDQTEINKVKSSSDSEYRKISNSDIQTYIDHINNVKSAIGTVANVPEKIKYNGQSIIKKSIDGYSKFKKYSQVTIDDMSLFLHELNTNAENTFEFTMEGVEISSLNFTVNNDPKIADEKYAVYKWMVKQNFDRKQDEDKKGKYNDRKKEADEQANDAKSDVLASVASKNDISKLEGLPSGSSDELDKGEITTKIETVSSKMKGLFTNFGSKLAQAGVNIRDDLFTVDYVTSMFTWSTYEYEAKYKMLDKNQQKNITYINAESYYSGKNDEWKNEDPVQKYNKTITNKLRNSEATNWSYCNEVEYIMYGKGVGASKASLNGTIYMIRYALNIPVIFSTFYSDTGLNSFALEINAASCGTIPAGLVKVVICLGLTALESARDLQTLKCGIPVIFIKTSEDDLFVQSWFFYAPANPKKTDKTEAYTFSYSDYMKLLLFIKLLGNNSYDVYGRIADVIQTNMSKCVLKDNDYSFKNSQVYYTIKADLKVKPLLLDTSYVKSFMSSAPSRMDNWNEIHYSATRGY